MRYDALRMTSRSLIEIQRCCAFEEIISRSFPGLAALFVIEIHFFFGTSEHECIALRKWFSVISG